MLIIKDLSKRIGNLIKLPIYFCKGISYPELAYTLGLPMTINVHEANVHDSKGAMPIIEKLSYKFPRLSKILADGGYLIGRIWQHE